MSNRDLQLLNLSFKFHDANYPLFSNLSINLLEKHPVIGILGRNGIGKTILGKILTGLQKPTSGRILLGSNDITSMKTSKRSRFISMTFQRSFSTFFKETVFDEILFTIKKCKKNPKERIEEELINKILEKNNFTNKALQNPLTLSGGERRKLNQIIFSIIKPEILILDEPTVGFDLFEKRKFINYIYQLKKKQRVIIITHDIGVLLRLTDRVLVFTKEKNRLSTIIGYNGSLHRFFLEDHFTEFPEITIPTEVKLFNFLKKQGKIPNEMNLKKFLESKI
ncbi:MAG: ABC transporter ATP-binding protein [Candidatus Hodarchaeales archaeon]